MRVGISVKWTLSAVLIVILVVGLYAYFTNNDTQKSVDQETERIRRIQYEALDQMGAQTAKTLSLPASSLMFDNDLEGLKGLIEPVIGDAKQDEKSYSAVYATIVAPEGRVWVTSVDSRFNKLDMAGSTYFDRVSGKNLENVDSALLEDLKREAAPKDVKRTVVTSDDKSLDLAIRQYAVPVQARQSEDGEAMAIQGYIILGYSIEALEKEIQAIQEQGELRKAEAYQRALYLSILAIIIGILIAGIQAFLITRNIKKLSRAAEQIAGGDLTVRSEIKSHDEIAQLSAQFNVMADRVQQLMKETEEKASLEKELDIARNIQSTLMPPQGYAECGRVSLNGYFQPATTCGGDFWCYNLLPDNSVLLTIGDVTGHGVPSAMITATAKSALETALHIQKNSRINIAQLLESLNVAVCQSAKRTLFMTFLAILISPDGRHAEVGNAGHNFPLMARGADVKQLVVRGERLGDNLNAKYETIQMDVQPGDLFLLFTDGLTEYLNAQNVEYGEKRLRRVLKGMTSAVDVNTAISTLWQDFSAFVGTAPQNDDITLMFSKIH